MTESERALLLAVGYWAIGACDIGSGHLRRINDAYIEANKAAKPAEPKPSARTLPQRLRSNSYNAPTWNDCDVMREAAHALENKDAEIAAVIRDNDAKMVEIERLKAERLALRAKLADPRNPDIEAAAKRLEKIDVPFSVFHHNYGMASHVGRLNDVGRIAVARAILTREPG